MVERSQLVQTLRDQLKDGATPLRLIRDIIAHLGDGASSREVQEVLAESFQLPVVRLGPSLDLSRKCYRQGILNRTMLAEISVGQALPVIGIQKRMPASVDGKKDKELEVAPPEKSAIKTFAGACWVNYPRFSSAQIATPGA